MSRTIRHEQPIERTFSPRQRAGAVIAAGLLTVTASCSIGSSDSPRDPGGNSRAENLRACTTPDTPVDAGSRFNRDNQDDIASQLDALRVAQNRRADVSVRNVYNAGSIVANSLRDPLYARAFAFANRNPEQVRTAGELLTRSFIVNRRDCLRHWQVDATEELYETLVAGLAPKAGRQISILAGNMYEKFAAELDEFRSTYQV